jgi:hypothetical protein
MLKEYWELCRNYKRRNSHYYPLNSAQYSLLFCFFFPLKKFRWDAVQNKSNWAKKPEILVKPVQSLSLFIAGR